MELLKSVAYAVIAGFVMWLLKQAIKKMSEDPGHEKEDNFDPIKIRNMFLCSIAVLFISAITAEIFHGFISIILWILFTFSLLSAWGSFDALYQNLNFPNKDIGEDKSDKGSN